MYVHNLSAVGEQYLDFEPADDEGPYVEDGDTLEGDGGLAADRRGATCSSSSTTFVGSVDEENLQVVVASSGTMFDDTGEPLQQLLDNGSRFVDEASAHTDETIALLDNGLRRAEHPAGRVGEHHVVLPRPATCSPTRWRAATSDLRQVLAGHARHRPRAQRAADATSSRPCRCCSATR